MAHSFEQSPSDQPLNLEAELRKLSPCQRQNLLEALHGPPLDISGRMPAKKVCTREFDDV
jgi:hypothetical protein